MDKLIKIAQLRENAKDFGGKTGKSVRMDKDSTRLEKLRFYRDCRRHLPSAHCR